MCIRDRATGLTGGPRINCYDALTIGKAGLQSMENVKFADLSFSRKSRVLPLIAATSTIKINDDIIPIDPTLLFQRISLSLEGPQNLKEYMHFELAPYPLTLFDQGTLRKTEKSKLYDISDKEEI